jgi:predicted TPR repeat methyltransferase
MNQRPPAQGHIFSRPASAPGPSRASDAERNTALAHYAGGDLVQAEAHCRRLTQRHPQDGFGWKVLGATLRQMKQVEASLEPMQIAAKLMPGDWEAFNNLGTTLDLLGQAAFAEACFDHALKLRPDFLEAWRNAAENLRRQNKPAQALGAYRQVCALAPDDGYARHMADTLSGTTSERAPDQYVTQVFNDYANTFDAHLTTSLQYSVPTDLVALLNQHAPAAAHSLDVIDLGCGTGLVGAAIAPFARHVTGVDLSPRMIEKSTARGVYQRLVCDDVQRMLNHEPAHSVDVILSADVFIYIGKLDGIAQEAQRVLRPGGRLVFSIETLGDDVGQAYRLECSGRYSQSLAYVNALASSHGFTVEATEPSVIRMEAQTPVPGHLCVWRT